MPSYRANKVFARYSQGLDHPLTIPGGYCFRDPANSAECSTETFIWFHIPGGIWSSNIFQSSSSVPAPRKPRIHAEVGRYRLRLAESVEDRDAACRLRFKVFNIELSEGLASSYQTGMDADQFDLFCEHLLVEDKLESNPARRVVGTYRMQSGATAARNLGYYSEQEFNFASYEPLRAGHSGTGPRLDRSRASHARGAHLVVEGYRAVC